MPTFTFVGFAFNRDNDELLATFKAANDAKVEVSLPEDDMRQMISGKMDKPFGVFPQAELEKALAVIAA